jgi:hypothetical protein
VASSFSIFREREMCEGLLHEIKMQQEKASRQSRDKDEKEIASINQKIRDLYRNRLPHSERVNRINNIEQNAAAYNNSSTLFQGYASDAYIWSTKQDELVQERQELRLKIAEIDASIGKLNKQKQAIVVILDKNKEDLQSTSTLSVRASKLQQRVKDYESIFQPPQELSDEPSTEEVPSGYVMLMT